MTESKTALWGEFHRDWYRFPSPPTEQEGLDGPKPTVAPCRARDRAELQQHGRSCSIGQRLIWEDLCHLLQLDNKQLITAEMLLAKPEGGNNT